MRSVRFTAGLLYHATRGIAVVVSFITLYALVVILLYIVHPSRIFTDAGVR